MIYLGNINDMQKYSRPKFEYENLGINPCTLTLEVPIRKLIKKNQFEKDKIDDIFLNVEVTVEATLYTKMYITADLRKIVSKLTPSAKELYLWIMYEIEAGEEALWINKVRFMLENSTSLNTYKKAIDELHKKAFIASTTVKDVYWINPNFFFKGDRVKKYPTKVKLLK